MKNLKLILKIVTLLLIINLIFSPKMYAAEDVSLVFNAWGNAIKTPEIPGDWQRIGPGIIKPSEVKVDDEFIILQQNYLGVPDVPVKYGKTTPNMQLDIFTSRGEYEPLCFAILAVHDLQQVNVEVGELKSQAGDRIAPEFIDIRAVMNFPFKIGEKKYSLLPQVLEKKSNVNIEKNSLKYFWITVFIPKRTSPGIYKGYLSVSALNAKPQKIRLEIKVLDIELKETGLKYGVYYNLDNRWQGFYPRNLEKHLRDIKEHGCNTAVIYCSPALRYEKGKPAIFDFRKKSAFFDYSMQQIMEAYKESGLKGPIPYLGVWYGLLGEVTKQSGYSEMSDNFDILYKQALQAIEEQREKSGWPEFLYSPEDEPFNDHQKFEKALHYLTIIKEILPSKRTYMSYGDRAKGSEKKDLLEKLVDVKGYAFYDARVQDAAIKNGKMESWLYNGGSGNIHPIQERFFYGFYALKSKASGILHWAYQWPASLKFTPYEELKHGVQGWYYTYPSAEGPVPTPAWEALREGIDDAKYCITLQALINKALNSKNELIIKQALLAQKDINNIMSRIELGHRNPQETAHAVLGYAPDWDMEILNNWRKTLSEDIIKLNLLLKGRTGEGND